MFILHDRQAAQSTMAALHVVLLSFSAGRADA